MFHPHETGCNSHVSIHGNCDVECLTSRAYHSYVNVGSKLTLACFYQTHFSRVSKLESKKKVICYIYAYIEKKSRNGGITICSFKLNATLNWVWSNYHGIQQQLLYVCGLLQRHQACAKVHVTPWCSTTV